VGDPLNQFEAGHTKLQKYGTGTFCDFGKFVDCLSGGPPVVREPGVHQLVGPALAQGGVRHLDQVSHSTHTDLFTHRVSST
jgi:hypothetical protein